MTSWLRFSSRYRLLSPCVSRAVVPVRLTVKGMTCMVLGLLGVIAAMVTGRAELVVLAAPFVALTGIASARSGEQRVGPIDAAMHVDSVRAAEGDQLAIKVFAAAGSAVRLDASAGVELEASAWTMPPTGLWQTTATLRRWGIQTIGPVFVRATDRFAMFAREGRVVEPMEVRVLPHDPQLERLVRARRTRAAFGNVVTAGFGSGIEFAEVRAMAQGDSWRAVNWRASARRDVPMVNVRHAERAADVILFIDTFSPESLTLAVRAAGSLARAYLAVRDRVGLVGLGGTITWHALAGGRNGLESILDDLLRLRVFPADGERDLRMIPRSAIPAHALVIALSPFVDERMVEAIAALRRRGHDVIAIELLVPTPAPKTDELSALAARLWEIEREHRRRCLRNVGIPVIACANTDDLVAGLGALV